MKKLVFLFIIMPALGNAQSKKSPGLSLAELNSFTAEDGMSYRPADTVVFTDGSRHAIRRINKYELDDGHTIVVYAKTTDGYYVPMSTNNTINNTPQAVPIEKVVNTPATTKEDRKSTSAKAVTPSKPAEKPTTINNYKLKTYTAGNGVVYKVGDLIGISKGSASNGDFLFLNKIGWAAAQGGNTDRFHAKSRMSDYKLEIKAINEIVYRSGKKIIFVVGGGNVADYELDIEEALNSCEVKSCDPVVAESMRQLQKLKAAGKIGETEYEREKAQLLKR